MKKIVLTGGPNGGKTTAVSIVHESFGSNIEIVKEAATMLYSGGYPRTDGSFEHVFRAQRIIYFLTQELEALAQNTAGPAAKLLVCDRGTVDGAVYWPQGQDAFFKAMNTTREAEFARYDLIIHLSPPAREDLYEKNTVRTETLAEAMAVDGRVLKAWEGHPNRIVIEKTAGYLEKAKIIKDTISNLLK